MAFIVAEAAIQCRVSSGERVVNRITILRTADIF